MNDLNATKTEISNLLYKNTEYVIDSDIRKILETLRIILRSSEYPLEDKYDMIGEIMMIRPEHFMKHLYPKIEKNRVTKKINLSITVDEYILKKYCFLEDEKIIAKCPGNIYAPGKDTFGRIYITNYRIIGCGIQKKNKGSFISLTSILTNVVLLAYNSAKSSAKIKKLSEALGKDISELGRWGYDFPINDVVSITEKKRNISYIKVLYGGKKPFKMKVGIFPLLPNKAERKEVLNITHQLLQKNMTKRNCPKCHVLMDPIEPLYLSCKEFICPNCRTKIIEELKDS